MRFLFATFAALLISLNAFAATVAEPKDEEESVLEKVPDNIKEQWSFGGYFQGSGNRSGLGLMIETPYAWKWLSLRLAGSRNDVSLGGPDGHVGFWAGSVGLKISSHARTSANVYPYVVVAYDIFSKLSNDAGADDSIGGRHGTEVLAGADLFFVSTQVFRPNDRGVGAVYVEGGLIDSSFRSTNQAGGADLWNGFLVRIGGRGYF